MKVLIVDDERLARDRIKSFLKDRVEELELFEASNGVLGLERLRQGGIDLLFLDIQMPELTGFEVLSQLKERNFLLIFQTAYDEFAIKAFEENACDYLLKPFSKDRFHKALDRALNQKSIREKLQSVESSLRSNGIFLTKFSVSVAGKLVLIHDHQVFAFRSEDHYTHLLTRDKSYIVDISLDKLEESLNPAKFLRVHRNCIINIDQIGSAQRGENMVLQLTNGLKTAVSRSSRKKVSALLKGR